jgi:hypothetical protein
MFKSVTIESAENVMHCRTFTNTALLITVLFTILCAQGLFESAGTTSGGSDSASPGSDNPQSKLLSLSGYVKGAVFGGKNDHLDPTILGSYGQTSLKLKTEKNGLGAAFAEIRLNAGAVRGAQPIICDVREAWGSFALKGFDIKLGRQIVAWGRADAVNPTNNITPKDELALSSEYDDTRLGNELLQLKTKIGPSTIQGIWVPTFRPDVLLINRSIIPAGIAIQDPVYPDEKFSNGSCALRLDITAPSIDGSLSYFNGYATLPGFDYALGASGLSLIPKAYRIQVIGGDFSTSIGSYGLRAEIAAKIPGNEYKTHSYIPNPYGQAVFGIDRSIGDWSLLVQYSGVYVNDFKKIIAPLLLNPLDPNEQRIYGAAVAEAEIKRLNRLFTGASDELSHSITANVQWNTMHETLHLKLSGLYNFTTAEYALLPDASYDIADAMSLSVGGRYLDGKDESLNHLVSHLMSHVYAELKISF